jgi:hypothetical protein
LLSINVLVRFAPREVLMTYRPMIRIAAVAIVACMTLAAAHAAAEPDAPVYASDTYPIRVFSDDETLGLAALADAEAAWAVQIEGMGFAPPLRVVGGVIEEGFDLYLDPSVSSNTLVTFDILGDDPSTPATDCPTIGLLNPIYMDDAALLTMCVRHVLNHGSLHAVDCIEPQMPAFDMFTVAVEMLTDNDHPYWQAHYLPDFQEIPWASLDFVITNPDYVFYMFGSALFTLFLEERYGDADGGLLVDAWARTPQDGTILTFNQEWCTADVDNEPDFLDAIAQELEARGATMDEALTAFTEWRYFVGADDDGAHFADGATWTGGEVARDATWAAADLPIDTGVVTKLAEWGSAYVELDPAGIPESKRLVVSFEGDPASQWAAQILLPAADGPAGNAPIPLDDGHNGASAEILTAPFTKVVLAVTNLGDGVHDPEDSEWGNANGNFDYRFELVDAPPPDAGAPDAGDDGGTDGASGGGGCGCRIATGGSGDASLLARLF